MGGRSAYGGKVYPYHLSELPDPQTSGGLLVTIEPGYAISGDFGSDLWGDRLGVDRAEMLVEIHRSGEKFSTFHGESGTHTMVMFFRTLLLLVLLPGLGSSARHQPYSIPGAQIQPQIVFPIFLKTDLVVKDTLYAGWDLRRTSHLIHPVTVFGVPCCHEILPAFAASLVIG